MEIPAVFLLESYGIALDFNCFFLAWSWKMSSFCGFVKGSSPNYSFQK
jgi:hypothetical protein